MEFIALAMILAAAIPSVRWLRDAEEMARARVTEMGPNDDESAENVFIELLDEAETEMVIYDDGDTTEGSLYQSDEVVRAISEKIDGNPGFKVRCVLNSCGGSTKFEQELAGKPNVSIRPRDADESRIHYKIIDERKAYVTRHRRGGKVRSRKMIDCTDAPSRRGGRPLLLRRYFDDFERHAG